MTGLNDLTDVLYDTTTDHNLVVGRKAALASGAALNVFVGQLAGATDVHSTSATCQNVAIGYTALASLTGGASNIAIGNAALYSSTSGSNNNAFGDSALTSNITGYDNNAFGAHALSANNYGYQNCAFGYYALQNLTTGSNNVALGSNTGATLTTGSGNILIGNSVDVPTSSTSNYLNIGGAITGDITTGPALMNGFTATTQSASDNSTLVATTAFVRSNLLNMTFPLSNYGGYGFTGSNYLDGNPLTGIADGSKGTFVAVIRFTNTASVNEIIFESTSGRVEILRQSGGQIEFLAKNVATSTTVLTIRSSTVAAAAGTYVIMASWDLATTGSGRIYINDVSDYNLILYTNDTIDYTTTEYSVGATTTGTSNFTGDIYSLWFDTSYIDFSVEANRRKFADNYNTPIFLGAAGELPTGTSPILFLGYSAYNAGWITNRGTGTGTFAEHTAADVSTKMYGQYDVAMNSTGTGSTVVYSVSPALTGTPTVPTAAAGTSTTQAASTAFVAGINNNASYRTVLQAGGSHIAGQAAGTYMMPVQGALAVSGVGTLTPVSIISIVGADWPTINGITPKLRVRATVSVNNTAPTGNFTVGLYPLTSGAGGAGVKIWTTGTLVTGSGSGTVTAPAGSSTTTVTGSDFAVPSDGVYALAVLTTATVAANSLVQVNAILQMRNA